MGKKKGQRNDRQFEVSWFDGRSPHCVHCDDKRRRRMLTVLEALPWVSQIRAVPVVMRR